MSGPGKWTLGGEPPEAATWEPVEPDEVEPGRAYDERGNVRPADERYTDADEDTETPDERPVVPDSTAPDADPVVSDPDAVKRPDNDEE